MSARFLFKGWARRAGWAMLALMLVLQTGAGSLFQIPRLALFDLYQRTLPRIRQTAPVVIVAVDDASLARVGQWPWPRQVEADLVSAILRGHPAALGIDVLWSEPDRQSPEQWLKSAGDLPAPLAAGLRLLPSHDLLFAKALSSGPVVIGSAGVSQANGGFGPLSPIFAAGEQNSPSTLPSFAGELRSIPALDYAAPGHGLLSVFPDEDGRVRRLPLLSRVSNNITPDLDLEMLRLAAHASYIGAYFSPAGLQGVRVGRLAVPTQADGSVWVHFTPHDSRRFVSAGDVLAGRIPAAAFDHRLVLLGLAGLGLTDQRLTPLGIMPGIEIRAQFLENVLEGRLVHRPDWARYAEPALTFLFSVLLIIFIPLLRPRWQIPAFLLPPIVLAAAGFWLWSGPLLLIDVATPAIGQALVALAILGGSFGEADAARRRLQRQRDFVQRTFSRYVSPKVVEQLINDPGKASLEGDRREMSFLFSDIQNFTAMSEKMDSRELTPLLNAYLDGMTRIVQEHDGMVDKFIGDAVFAIFNAPVDIENHAEKAVRCQLALDRFTQQFKAEKNAAGIAFGFTRIGVHTGVAVVGNFGSSERIAYTAAGNAVNTAARLEGLNKYFGTRLCTTADTKAGCGTIRFRPVASVVVKGRMEAVEVWEPLHDDAPAVRYLARYSAAFEAMEQELPEALDLFSQLQREFPGDPLVDLHVTRLQAGAKGARIVMADK